MTTRPDAEQEATSIAGRFLTSALQFVAAETCLKRVHEAFPAEFADRFAVLVAAMVAAQVRIYASLSGEEHGVSGLSTLDEVGLVGLQDAGPCVSARGAGTDTMERRA